jgi:thymidylate synthase
MKPIVIEQPTLAKAYEATIKYILDNGYYQLTEDGEHTVETDQITIYVDTPFRPDRLSKLAPQKEASAKEYARQLLEGTNGGFDYDYHGQLYEWATYHIHGIKKVHNQIAFIKEKLLEQPLSRRAICIIFDPSKHQYTDESVPCAQLIQFIIRNGLLHMRIVFRSNDMLTASAHNMYGFTTLQKNVADALDVGTGSYTHTALTPHIYHVRDANILEDFIEGYNEDICRDNLDKITMKYWILLHIENFRNTGRI